MKRCDKALRKAYRKGRKDGFDHGFNTAKMIFAEAAAMMIEDVKMEYRREIEALNSELILATEEEGEDEDEQRLDS